MTDHADHARRRSAIEHYFRCVDANDLDGLLGVFDDAVVYQRPGYDTIEGIGQLRDFYDTERVIERGSHDVEGIVVEGDSAAAWGSFRGVARTGEQLDEQWSDVYRFVGSRISFRRSHFFRPAI